MQSVQSTQTKKHMCRVTYRAWTWNLLLFPDPLSSFYALVLDMNKKELDDWKFSLVDRKNVERERRPTMESVDQKRVCTSFVADGRNEGFRMIITAPMRHVRTAEQSGETMQPESRVKESLDTWTHRLERTGRTPLPGLQYKSR